MNINEQRHVIKKQILELELSSKKGAFELQNQVSKIYREKIVPLIDTYCSQLSSPDVIDKINRLELNLGNIDINNLEQDLIQKVETQIKQQLTKKINSNKSSFSASERSPHASNLESTRRSPHASNLETISYFIQTGTLPWHSEKLSKQELEKCFDQLIETSPEQVKRLLLDFFKDQNYLRRIIYQFSDQTLLKITNLFSAKLSQFITDYNKEISEILSQVDNFKHISLAKSRLERWRGILLSFAFNQNYQFENSQFVRENLLHLATTFQINHASLINNLTKTVEHLQKENKTTFKSQLLETFQTNSNLESTWRSPHASNLESTRRSSQTASNLETISYFIQTGTLPWHSEKLSKQELEKCFDQLIETSPEQVKRLLLDFFKDQNYLRRIIYQFSDSTLIKITNLFSVKLSRFITDYNKEISEILSQVDNFKHISLAKFRLERWRGILLSFTFNQNSQFEISQFVKENLLYLATSFQINYASLINNLTKTVERLERENKTTFKNQLTEILSQIQAQIQQIEEIDTSRDNQQTKNQLLETLSELEVQIEEPDTSNKNQLSTQPQPQDNVLDFGDRAERTSAANRFNDADEIYINNSGLILLWPFYKRLFEKIELVQQGSFINPNAAQKAVLILQYLVDATTEISESNLPLNKLLCGIDIFEPMATSLDLTEAEISECETLLSAAIANWSVLKNTSIAGFRKTFLQREGILRIRHGSWLLQVERQTYDILLDRIPWSIRAIKLPWIDEILYVEW